MASFLEILCDDILLKYGENISDICVVFPSRRAGLFFKNIIGKKINAPIWSPDVYSIEDFVEKFSDLSITDNFKLIVELYSVYSDVLKSENVLFENSKDNSWENNSLDNFDNFYPWGEMLLQDFDEIDKYLADAKLVFKGIKNIKEIEASFPIEIQENLKKFWKTLFDYSQTEAKNNFIKIWNILEKVYREFKNRLENEGICFPGMAYRRLYEKTDDISDSIRWKKIIFAGFNSLTTAEKSIMKKLIDKGLAEIYWDIDEYYFSDNNQEAGNFIRENLKYFGREGIKIENNLLNSDKRLEVIGTSSSTGMAKVLGSELKELLNCGQINPEKTVLVLPDSKLLLPVLYSIPDEVRKINVTMGFPFRDTILFSLLHLLIDLQNDYVLENGKIKFNYLIVKKILLHPFVKYYDVAIVYNIIEFIESENLVYFQIDDYRHDVPEMLKIIFRRVNDMNDAVEYFKDIIGRISSGIDKDVNKDTDYKIFQLEFMYNFYTNFNRLCEVIKENQVEMSINTYFRLLKNVLRKISVPFTGEPLQGLQVMGLLETRTLDFENVFLLSANEGVLPEGKVNNSFIPYSIRKSVNMPTYEDEDSVTSYYFYRLLQRTKNMFIIYDTDTGKEVKEKSRYILQIENELVSKNKKINYKHRIVLPELKNIEKKDICIEKSDKIKDKIKNAGNLSPSSLIKYINCPLQFYFNKIAKIEAKTEIEESFDSKSVGNVLHSVLENIYLPFKGNIINEKVLEGIIEDYKYNFNKKIDIAIKNAGNEFVLNDYRGKNNLFKNIINKLIIRVLENERKLVPFKIVDTELEIKSNFDFGSGVTGITGRIDRIDEKDGIIRIIDYKTGSYKLNKYNKDNPEEYFEMLITHPDYKENFQAFFYGYFYWKAHPGEKINVIIYPVKKISDGIKELKSEFITEEEFVMFENKLKKIMLEIYNPDFPFRQTEDEKRCTYCAYSSFCYRDLKNTI